MHFRRNHVVCEETSGSVKLELEASLGNTLASFMVSWVRALDAVKESIVCLRRIRQLSSERRRTDKDLLPTSKDLTQRSRDFIKPSVGRRLLPALCSAHRCVSRCVWENRFNPQSHAAALHNVRVLHFIVIIIIIIVSRTRSSWQQARVQEHSWKILWCSTSYDKRQYLFISFFFLSFVILHF